MLEIGYVKLCRSLLSWEWYDDPNTFRVFIHLLLTANYEPKKWRGISIERGQRVASYATLASELNLSMKSVRTAIGHLKRTGEVAHLSTPEYGLFTVNNYDKYQDAADREADEGHTSGTRAAYEGQSTGSQEAYERQSSGTQAAGEGQQCKKDKKDKNIYTGDDARAREPTLAFGEFGKVKLTQGRYDALVQQMGKGSTDEYIVKLDTYMASKGRYYSDHYATILSWWREDQCKCANRSREQKRQDARDPRSTAGSSLDYGTIDDMIDGQFDGEGNT